MASDPILMRRTASLAETLADRLRQDIAEKRLLPGAQLPTEAQMAQSYGVSRATVREGIGRLKHDGLVITRQGAGAFVANRDEIASFRFRAPDIGNREELWQVIDFLMGFECQATALAAQHRTDVQMAALRTHLDNMEQATAQGAPGTESDVAFHRTLMEASGNPLFTEFAAFLEARVRAFIRTARANTAHSRPDLATEVHAEHRRICETVERGDSTAAWHAARAHLVGARKRLLSSQD